MNWEKGPWELVDVPWPWLQWVIDYQVACNDAESMRAQIKAARGKNQKGGG